MKKIITVCMALVMILLFIFNYRMAIAENRSNDKTTSGKVDEKQKKYSSETIIIKEKKNVQASAVEAVFDNVGVKVKKKLKKTGVTIVTVKDKKKSIKNIINQLNESNLIEYAEPDYEVHADVFPNDPSFDALWGLHNNSIDADIDAPEAWDITTGNSNIVVAVIDSGVDYQHEDLAANMWINTNEIAGNNMDDDGNGYIDDIYGIDAANNDSDPDDDEGHGTHCAGTIGAVGNNGVGVAGVNWNVKIMACKFLDSSGNGYISDAIECLEYILNHKINGVNVYLTSNSWGGGGYTQALYDAIQSTGDENMLFIAAAGNSSLNTDSYPHYPSSYNLDNIISVAATDNNDDLSEFSNYGATSVDLGAPGSGILSTTPGNTYSTKSGTSMATPHVAGAVALVWGQNTSADYASVKNLILGTTDPLPSLSSITVTGGRLNVNDAVTCEDGPSMDISPDNGFQVSLSDDVVIFVTLRDCLTPIIDATVTVVTSFAQNFHLLDDGVLPDTTANDGIYTGNWTPLVVGSVTLTIAASFNEQTLNDIISGEVIKNYTINDQVSYNWTDATTGVNTGITDDDTSAAIPIGFDFEFYGTTYNTVKVSSNGYLTFGDQVGDAFNNTTIPSAVTPNEIIAPFWDDLNPSNGGAIYYLLEGTSPNRTLTIEWHNIPHFENIGNTTFETILYEGSNNILFQYQDASFGNASYDYGKSATVGVENSNGNYGKLYSYNSNNITNGLAVLFTMQNSDTAAYYTFNEGSGIDAMDASGNGNNGTINGTAWSTGVGGSPGLDFDGVDDSVDYTTNLGITGELTVSAWVYPTAAPGGVGRIIASTYDWDGTASLIRGWTLGLNYGSNDRIQFLVFDSAGNSATATLNGFFASNINQWTHVVGVFSPSQHARLYVNGIMVASDTTSIPAGIGYKAGTNLRIGKRADNTTQGMWQGGIDEVCIYDRALTDQEVQDLYNSVAPTPTPVVTPSPTPSPTPTPATEPNLQAYYALDEGTGLTAGDSSGNGHNGTINGALWTTGKSGNGLDFDGVDDSVNFSTNLGITGALTVSAWVYPTAAPSGVGRIIASTYDWDSAASLIRGWTLGLNYGSNDRIQFLVYDSTGNSAMATLNGFFASNLNQWTHVVGVFSPSQHARLYVNGVMVASDTTSIPAGIGYKAGTNLRIGKRADNTTQGVWQGDIDEVRLYDRAMTDQEVQDLYNGVTPTPTPTVTPSPTPTPLLDDAQANYQFEEGSGTVTSDSSGNGNHGIINGATWTTGKNGNGLDFDGVDDSVNFSSNLGITGALTVSAWVYPKAAPTGVGRIIASTYDWDGTASLIRGWTLGLNYGSNDRIQFLVYDSTGNSAIATLNGFFASNINQWTHVVGVFSPSQHARLYVNGVMVASDTTSIPAGIGYKAGTNLRIGKRADNTTQGMWQGGIDEVRIYDRVFSDQEVLNLYNGL